MKNFKEEKFVVTIDHIKLLKEANITLNYGELDEIPGLCTKRPFGNSGLAWDVANILGWPFDKNEEEEDFPEEYYDKSEKITTELKIPLQILCQNLSIKEGTWIKIDCGNWEYLE